MVHSTQIHGKHSNQEIKVEERITVEHADDNCSSSSCSSRHTDTKVSRNLKKAADVTREAGAALTHAAGNTLAAGYNMGKDLGHDASKAVRKGASITSETVSDAAAYTAKGARLAKDKAGDALDVVAGVAEEALHSAAKMVSSATNAITRSVTNTADSIKRGISHEHERVAVEHHTYNDSSSSSECDQDSTNNHNVPHQVKCPTSIQNKSSESYCGQNSNKKYCESKGKCTTVNPIHCDTKCNTVTGKCTTTCKQYPDNGCSSNKTEHCESKAHPTSFIAAREAETRYNPKSGKYESVCRTTYADAAKACETVWDSRTGETVTRCITNPNSRCVKDASGVVHCGPQKMNHECAQPTHVYTPSANHRTVSSHAARHHSALATAAASAASKYSYTPSPRHIPDEHGVYHYTEPSHHPQGKPGRMPSLEGTALNKSSYNNTHCPTNSNICNPSGANKCHSKGCETKEFCAKTYTFNDDLGDQSEVYHVEWTGGSNLNNNNKH